MNNFLNNFISLTQMLIYVQQLFEQSEGKGRQEDCGLITRLAEKQIKVTDVTWWIQWGR